MSDWNTEQARHKAAKRGITPLREKPMNKPKKIDKPWEVWRVPYEFEWQLRLGKAAPVDHRSGKYATLEQAAAWIEKQARHWYMSRQNQSPRATEQAMAEARENAAAFYILGPDGYDSRSVK